METSEKDTLLGAVSPKRATYAIVYAYQGIWHALKTDSSFLRIVLGEIALAIFLAWLLWPAHPIEIAALVIAFRGPLVAELQNVGIERLADHMYRRKHEAIKQAKDCGAGSVLTSLIFGLAVVALVVWHHFS